jgi:hypothetical protein
MCLHRLLGMIFSPLMCVYGYVFVDSAFFEALGIKAFAGIGC